MIARARKATGPVRVLVVDDSPFMRKAIGRMLSAVPGIEVVALAASGREAVECLERLAPDVVTLDVVMPGMDGVQTLEHIMRVHPVPVIMVSSLTRENAEVTLSALEAGAVDFVEKPSGMPNMNMPTIAGDLARKILAVASVDLGRIAEARHSEPALTPQSASPAPTPSLAEQPAAQPAADIVVIGCSTGGPPALQRLLTALPSDFPVPVVVVQHMPEGFTAALAERLDRNCQLEVREVRDQDLVRPGRILIAKSGRQLHFARRGERVVTRLDLTPSDTPHTPSIDVAMNSAAEVYGSRTLATLLTGMGADGARGMVAVRGAGGMTLAEAESSAVIFGMPKVAAELGGVEEMLDLSQIASRIVARSLGQAR